MNHLTKTLITLGLVALIVCQALSAAKHNKRARRFISHDEDNGELFSEFGSAQARWADFKMEDAAVVVKENNLDQSQIQYVAYHGEESDPNVVPEEYDLDEAYFKFEAPKETPEVVVDPTTTQAPQTEAPETEGPKKTQGPRYEPEDYEDRDNEIDI